MDPDQDILSELDRREAAKCLPTAFVVAAISVLAGILAFFTLRLQMSMTLDGSLDGAGLVVLAAMALLLIAHRVIGAALGPDEQA